MNSNAHATNLKRLNNLRSNQAVEPPRLPAYLIFQDPFGQSESNHKSSPSASSLAKNGRSNIDLSQSPITRRLLNDSKDYKVSELNSQDESDCEHSRVALEHVAKTEKLVKEACANAKLGSFQDSSMDATELTNSRGETMRQLNEILAKKPHGPLGSSVSMLAKNSLNDRPLSNSTLTLNSREDTKNPRSDEKLERRKIKEDERLRRQERKMSSSKKNKSSLAEMNLVGEDGIPLFIKCCIEFIESEGLDAEGIYRVPGNKAHVNAFIQDFKENPDMSLLDSDIPVNAVATALKDFLSKRWSPIIPSELMNELIELSNISDRHKRVEAVEGLVNKLPTANYKLLKYVFSHFVKISSNSALNSMDSKNLAICWWPTLLPLQFTDMVMFEQMRPHLEETIQTMIDWFDFIFPYDEPVADRIDRLRKPGKLDLRQFDNIATAIGTLSVQPLSSSPPGVTSSKTAKIFNKCPANPNQQTKSNAHATNLRRLSNLRGNQSVEPPRLPAYLIFQDSYGRSDGNQKSSQNANSSSNRRSDVDQSQSPIARRLLNDSKDYRVSELNSPDPSDCEQGRNATDHAVKNDIASSRGETMRQLNEILAKKPPGPLGPNISKLTRGPSNDQLLSDSALTSSSKKDEKDGKKDTKKSKNDEKVEKRKIKEEKLRRQEQEKQRRQEKKLAGKKSKSALPNLDSIGEDGIPLFIKCCIEFIESEGLDAEGIYRVPGNRAHVDAFIQDFKENPDMSLLDSDIPVNAVATALKDFLSKRWSPIIPSELMNELIELSNISDRHKRVEAVEGLVNKLPTANYKLLKYVFSHFVKISSNSALNSMDSKNLAICWWPTLLPLQFTDMVMFEQMRPHLEETTQTMIDHFEFVFANDKPDNAAH